MTLVTVLNEMKCIYGICPCCGELFRLSDATVFTKLPPPKTEFDKLDEALERLARQTEKFGEREAAIREKARQKGQKEASKRIRKLAPFFVDRRIEPHDVKVLFHPVEYLVFHGLTDDRCTALEFVDHHPDSRAREQIQQSLSRAIRSGNLDWRTYRVQTDGTVTVAEAKTD